MVRRWPSGRHGALQAAKRAFREKRTTRLAFDPGAPWVEISRGTRHVLSIAIAKAAHSAECREALLECDESAVRAAGSIIGAPRVVLGYGTVSARGRHNQKRKHEC